MRQRMAGIGAGVKYIRIQFSEFGNMVERNGGSVIALLGLSMQEGAAGLYMDAEVGGSDIVRSRANFSLSIRKGEHRQRTCTK